MESRSIAIDGPSGAGKSTLARMTAKKYGLIYVDTGALYRTVGLYVKRRGVGSKDLEGVARLLPEIGVEMRYDGDGLHGALRDRGGTPGGLAADVDDGGLGFAVQPEGLQGDVGLLLRVVDGATDRADLQAQAIEAGGQLVEHGFTVPTLFPGRSFMFSADVADRGCARAVGRP